MQKSERTYSELIAIPSRIERFRYLQLNGTPGEITFGNERYINQLLYKLPEWKELRREVIIRDNGCDMALAGNDISGPIYVHHMNPISYEDIVNRTKKVLDPENLVCVSFNTHQAIHYGDEMLFTKDDIVERRPNDTIPWR